MAVSSCTQEHTELQGLPDVAAAAGDLNGAPIHVAFVGERLGQTQAAERRAANLALTNDSTPLSGVPHEEMPELLAAADICLVPLRDVPLFTTFIPSKMFERLADRGLEQAPRPESPRRSCARPER